MIDRQGDQLGNPLRQTMPFPWIHFGGPPCRLRVHSMDACQLYQRRHEGILGMLMLGMLEEGPHLQVVLDNVVNDPDPHQLGDLGDHLCIRVFLLDEGGLDDLLEIN